MATKREIRHVLTLDGERQYTSAMQSVATALKGTKSEQALLDTEFGKGNKSIERMTKQHALLGKRLDEQRKALKLIADAYEKSRQKTGENSEVTQSLARDMNYAEAAVKKTEREIADLGVAMAKSTSRVEQFKAAMREAGITAESIGRGIEKLGTTMTKYITTSVVAGLTATTKMAMDYGDVLAKLGTLSDAAAYGVDKLGEQAMAASSRTGMAIADMIEAVYNTISSGVSAGDAVSLVEQAAMAAAAGGANLDDVIRGMASTLNGWKMSAGDATSVLDRFLLAAEAGTVEIGDLASNIGTVTGLAPQMNVSLNEILAAVEALSLGGVEAGSAFTGLRAIMSAVLKPSSEATKEAERLGLSFDVAALKAKGLTGFLADVQEKTKGDEESLAKLFGRVEALSAIMALGTSAAGDYADVLETLQNSAGTLDEKFGIRMASDTMKLKVSLNELRNAAISLGEQVTPYIEMFTTKLSGLAQYLSEMTDEERQQAIQIALIVAAAGPLLTIVGKLIQSGKQIGTMIKGLSTLVGGGGTLAAITLGLVGVVALLSAIGSHMAKIREEQRVTFNLGVDTSALEKIDIDTSTVNVAVQNVAIASSGKSLYDEIVAWLTDGLPETPEEVAAMTEKVNGVIAQCYTNIETEFNTKKAALDLQLAGGLITQEQYDTELASLQTKTTGFTTELDASAAAVTEYIATLVASNRAPTEEQIAYLQQLIDKLVETGQAANEATNAVMAGYEFAYNRANMGFATTPEEYGQAGKYIETNRAAQLEAIESRKATLQGEYGTQVAGISPASPGYTEAATNYTAELNALNEAAAEVNATADEMWAGLLGEAVEGTGVTVEALQSFAEAKAVMADVESDPSYKTFGLPGLKDGGVAYLEAKEIVDSFQETVDELDTTQLAAVATAMSQLGIAIDTTDTTTILEDIAAFMAGFEEVKQAAAETISDMGAKAEEAGETTIDRTQSGAATRRAMLKRDMRKTGQESVQGLIDGANSKQIELAAAYSALGTAAATAMRRTLQVQSPSRVFREIGEQTIMGFIDGTNARARQANRTVAEVINPRKVAEDQAARGRAVVPATTYNTTVHYTGGITARDAKRMTAVIEDQQRRRARGQGAL